MYSPEQRRFFESKLLPQLNMARAATKSQVDAISAIINYEEANETRATRNAVKIAGIEAKMTRISKEIEEIEFPRDESMDNNIIVILSTQFSDNDNGAHAETAASLSDDVVHKLCLNLEDSGYSVRRISRRSKCLYDA